MERSAMTEREFDQIRNSYYSRNSSKKQEDEGSSGYFAYFKIRCLICLIILLSIIILDRQIGIKQYNEVIRCMELLSEEEITVEECLSILNLTN